MCQANARQHTLRIWELRGKPHKCKKSELVLKGLNVKVCGPQEKLFFPFCHKGQGWDNWQNLHKVNKLDDNIVSVLISHFDHQTVVFIRDRPCF